MIASCNILGVQRIGQDCCGNVFDVKPIFTAKGVCYTSKLRQVARLASDMESVLIWLTPMKKDIAYSGNQFFILTFWHLDSKW